MSLSQLINATRRTGPVFSIKGLAFGFQGKEPVPELPPELMLQKLEAAGANPQDLAEALMDAFHLIVVGR